ncbi:hypothetical protein T484DRAFT_1889688 [Baffinella frigidus]|nr:hypothetical protein T484DRAFT_1889688 [Cryptophyta sp. CCMP2293]
MSGGKDTWTGCRSGKCEVCGLNFANEPSSNSCKCEWTCQCEGCCMGRKNTGCHHSSCQLCGLNGMDEGCKCEWTCGCHECRHDREYAAKNPPDGGPPGDEPAAPGEKQPQAEASAGAAGAAGGSGVTAVVGMLAKTVAGLQDAMGSAYTRMSGSLQQSLSMMEQMNDCMEHYVQAGITISAAITPPAPASARGTNGGDGLALPAVRITVRNAIKLPVSKILFSLSLSAAHTADAGPVPLLLQTIDLPASPPAKRQRTAPHASSDAPASSASRDDVPAQGARDAAGAPARPQFPWRRRAAAAGAASGAGGGAGGSSAGDGGACDGGGGSTRGGDGGGGAAAESGEENVYEAGPFDLGPGESVSWLVEFAPPEAI